MDEIIKIKCPFDGAVLSVKNLPGIENKSVTCPICKNKYPFSQYRRVVDTPAPRQSEETDHTQLPTLNYTIGSLIHKETGASYRLKPGKNVIGRKASNSSADIKIDTGDLRSMSRDHLVIDVKKEPGKGYVHYVALFKERVNETKINNMTLLYGDCLILEDGSLLKLPDCTLEFRIQGDEDTNF